MSQRLVEFILFLENQRQVIVCLAGVGTQPQSLAATGLGLVEPPLFAEHIPQRAVRLGVAGAKMNGLP